ncbi:MAG: 4'-phosphopantetheinyl transferase superfamily protein [Bacteroidota bacterium]|nr:4'-phosphopantetheinyl transferase superfamily protein [Bacteroidota bacterium]
MNLNSGEIHIWSTAIDERFEKTSAGSFLSESERRNAKKFTYDIDNFLFTVRHNLLRIILGNYLNCNPAKIKFNSNHYQKPHITHPNTNIQFNISSSANLFLAAFCQRNSIGVDLELIRPVQDIELMVSDYFTTNEATWVNSHTGFMIENAFLSVWSKKEALIKAIGRGLYIEPNQFDVLSEGPISYGDSEWYISPLNISPDCIGAVAVNNAPPIIHYFDAAELVSIPVGL